MSVALGSVAGLELLLKVAEGFLGLPSVQGVDPREIAFFYLILVLLSYKERQFFKRHFYFASVCTALENLWLLQMQAVSFNCRHRLSSEYFL